MTIGSDETPLKSIKKSLYIKNKTEFMIRPNIFYGNMDNTIKEYSQSNQYDLNDSANKDIKILHLDINNSKDLTKNLSSYEITNLIIKLYATISDVFLKEECLAFYLGGDNFMIVSKEDITMEKIKEIIEFLARSTKINLNCGIGDGRTGRKAAEMATKSLDLIREFRKNGKRINVHGCFD